MSFVDYPRITPFLWFDHQAEDAAKFYVSLFKNSRLMGDFSTSVAEANATPNKPLTVSFELEGIKFTALNGGPGHPFSDSFSLVIRCDSQEEIDHYWSSLTEDGGAEGRCGWCKDKFGLSWQVIPADLMKLLSHPSAMRAMMGMKKMDIAALEAAAKE